MKVATTALALVILGLAIQFASSTASLPSSSLASAGHHKSNLVKRTAMLQRRRSLFGKKGSTSNKGTSSHQSSEKKSSGTRDAVKEAVISSGVTTGMKMAAGAALA